MRHEEETGYPKETNDEDTHKHNSEVHMTTKFVLVISDLHVGGAYGLFPKNFIASTGNEIGLNIGQTYLWECWQHLLATLPQTIDILVLNGDLCEGQNPSEEARMLSEVDPMFQARAATALLAPIVKRVSGSVYATSGSRYHVGRGSSLDEVVAKRAGAVANTQGHHARAWLRFAVGDTMFDCSHHQSYMMRYRSTALAREIGFALELAARSGTKPPNVIVRSHTHVGLRIWREDNDRLAIGTPAFKLQDIFAASSKTPSRLVPSRIGVTGLVVHQEPVDGFKVRIIPYLYEHPALEIEKAP